jgi:hypothetical protein
MRREGWQCGRTRLVGDLHDFYIKKRLDQCLRQKGWPEGTDSAQCAQLTISLWGVIV